MRRFLRPALVILLFLGCTLYFLQPFSTSPGGVVPEHIDCLLNASTMYRIQEHIANGEWSELYEGHYFYPRKEVLAYSETILPIAIISWPVTALTENPIAGHNFALLLSFFLTGLLTYLLAKYLTGSTTAAVVAGIFNAFWVYMMHSMHALQTVTTYWLPLTMICLHKHWRTPRARYIILAAVFYAIQTLSCVYLGLIFSFAVFLIFLFMTLSQYWQDRADGAVQGTGRSRTTAHVSISKYFASPLFVLIFGALVIWPILPYFRLLDRLLQHRQPPGMIARLSLPFPGPVCVGLLVAGWLLLWWRSRAADVGSERQERGRPRLLWLVVAANRVSLAIMLAGFVINHFDIRVFRAQSAPLSLAYPVCAFLLTGLTAMSVRKLKAGRFMQRLSDEEALYLVIAFAAYFLAFGDTITLAGRCYGQGPFALLARAVPPFGAIRAPVRFWFLFTFAFWMLLAFAVKRIETFLADKSLPKTTNVFRVAVVAFALLTVLPELPLAHQPALTRANMPACYKWLAQQDEEFVILDVPSIWQEAIYQYYALFHNKKIVNGYSRYFPPENAVVKRAFSGRDISKWPGELLNEIGVKYLLLHLDELDGPPIEGYGPLPANEQRSTLSVVRHFDDCWVLQTEPSRKNETIGPLLESRTLVFEASFGHGDARWAGPFGDVRPSGRAEVKRVDDNEILITFVQPTIVDGIFLDFRHPIEGHIPVPAVSVQNPAGAFEEVQIMVESMLHEYRNALYGERFAGVYEYSFRRLATTAIKVRVDTGRMSPSMSGVDCFGFCFKRGPGSGTSPIGPIAD